MISKLQDFRLTLLGKELLPVNSVKDLGVVFDSKLLFINHIIKTVSSCMSAFGEISQVNMYLGKTYLLHRDYFMVSELVLFLFTCCEG